MSFRSVLSLLALSTVLAAATPAAALLSGNPVWTAEGNQLQANLGYFVWTAGDVNGDGYDDVIVSAPFFDNGQLDEGRAYVHHGSATGLSASPDWTGEVNKAQAWFGVAVSAAGDVNGDGYDDVIVGAPKFANGQADEGRSFVYLGSATGLAASPSWTAESNQASAFFGISVASAGDVNGDGFDDVIVGARNYDNGQSNEGRAFVFYGSPTGPSLVANWTAESDQADSQYGMSVATAGDVNGDGFDDVIVGAPNFSNGQFNEGRAFVYQGSVAGLAATAAWTAESNSTNGTFGNSVATAGDVNGDGFDDVIVGSYFFSNGQSNEGRAYAFHGSAAGLGAVASWVVESNQVGANLGTSVCTAGDVNGDGYDDVVVGAWAYDNGQGNEGRVLVYSGSAAGLNATAAWTAEPDEDGAFLGTAVGTAGDVNGDGYDDVIAGAPYVDDPEGDEGKAYVYLGKPTWKNLGGGITGSNGLPLLQGGGDLVGGQPVTLTLTQAKPATPVTLIVGLSQLALPFKGGTLVPSPSILIFALPTNGSGALALSSTWPTGLPAAFSFYTQYWIPDAAGPAGFAASNGLSGTTP